MDQIDALLAGILGNGVEPRLLFPETSPCFFTSSPIAIHQSYDIRIYIDGQRSNCLLYS